MAIAADAPGGAPPALNPPSLPDAAAIEADAFARGGAPPARAPPLPPPAAAAEPPPRAQAAPGGGGGEPTLNQVRQLLRRALKIPTPRSGQPTIGGGVSPTAHISPGRKSSLVIVPKRLANGNSGPQKTWVPALFRIRN